MNISKPFIDRPIATTLLTIGVILLGLMGYRSLPVSALPSVDFPTIQITTEYPGAAPTTMASAVTTPLESQFGQIPGLASMVSSTSFGFSAITLQFALDRNIDSAAQDVQAAITAAAGQLPRTLPDPPIYRKVNPADTPVLVLSLRSDTMTLQQLRDLAETRLGQKLSQVTGVGLVAIEGGQRPAVRIQADPSALAGVGMTLAELRTAIGATNVNIPKGDLDGRRQSYQLATNDQLRSADEYKSLIVAYKNGAPVRLADVARIVDGVENERLAAWHDGDPAILLNIQRQPGANVVEVVDRIKAVLPELRASLPAPVVLAIVADRTETIRAAIKDVQFTLVLTIALVVMVIFLFLRRIWATVIPSVSLPLSIILTFGVMHWLGYSLNNLSLMALTISAGFVVDDAIVMIENIHRYREMGKSAREAAILGSRQIGFTIVSLTVSLVAVFIPLLFMGGIIGRLFREFAVTLSVAVVVSALVSLTLTPMMCAKLLGRDERRRDPRRPGLGERGFAALTRGYGYSVDWVLKHQTLMTLVTLATLAATVWLYVQVPKGFIPVQDTGLVIGVTDAAQDISFAAMRARQQEVAARLAKDPDVQSVTSYIGIGPVNATGNTGRLSIVLKPRTSRPEPMAETIRRLQASVTGIAGITLYLQPAQDIQIDNRVARTLYRYTIQDADVARLQEWTPKLVDAMRRQPELRDVASDQQANGLVAALKVNRDDASRMGVSLQAIDDALYDAFGQRQISTIFTELNQYHVILEVQPAVKADPKGLDRLYVRAGLASASPSGSDPATAAATGAGLPTGALVPLSTFANWTPAPGALALTRLDQFPAVTLSFDIAHGASIEQAISAIHRAEAEIGLPGSVTGRFSGQAAEFQRALSAQPLLILAAIVVVYIVLGVLYESFIHPITILSTLPSAGLGALLALRATGHPLDVIALIGIILLIGIVKKNAIMMIDFALEAERGRGLTPAQAIAEACLLRFRPIMMTTMAALLGALPLALEQGVGSELRQPLGIAIVGGLVLSQILTLFTTPVVYLGFARLSAAWARRGMRDEAPTPARTDAPALLLGASTEAD